MNPRPLGKFAQDQMWLEKTVKSRRAAGVVTQTLAIERNRLPTNADRALDTDQLLVVQLAPLVGVLDLTPIPDLPEAVEGEIEAHAFVALVANHAVI